MRLIKGTAGDRDAGESSGWIYLEIRPAGVSSGTAARVRHAFLPLS